jgi:hypothetical protein
LLAAFGLTLGVVDITWLKDQGNKQTKTITITITITVHNYNMDLGYLGLF